MRLYKTDLGATYWVFAERPEDVLRIIVETYCGPLKDGQTWESVAAYEMDAEDYDPATDAVECPEGEELRMHCDDIEGGTRKTAAEWIRAEGQTEGVLGCSEW